MLYKCRSVIGYKDAGRATYSITGDAVLATGAGTVVLDIGTALELMFPDGNYPEEVTYFYHPFKSYSAKDFSEWLEVNRLAKNFGSKLLNTVMRHAPDPIKPALSVNPRVTMRVAAGRRVPFLRIKNAPVALYYGKGRTSEFVKADVNVILAKDKTFLLGLTFLRHFCFKSLPGMDREWTQCKKKTPAPVYLLTRCINRKKGVDRECCRRCEVR